MFDEESAGCVLFHRVDGEIMYLLLRYGMGHWGFPKGLIEVGEKEKEAAIREVQEETGIFALELRDNFKEKVQYCYQRQGKTIQKEVVFFLAEAKMGEVSLSFEHSEYKWLPFDDALEQLSFDNVKQVLRKAHHIVSQ